MRIPTHIPLEAWLRQLMKENRLALFYLTDEWKELREDVLRSCHYECQHCLAKGRYTKADCVHHHNEVRKRPELALSKFYTDSRGQRQANLIPLCNTCHNLVHEKLKKWQQKDKFTNEERW